MVQISKLVLAFLLGVEGARYKQHAASNTSKMWQGKLLPGHIDIKRPAFLMLDEKKEQVVVSQFGFATKPTTWNPIPDSAASSISTIKLDDLKKQMKRGRLSGKTGDIFVSTNANLMWPNKLSRAPYGDFIVVPDGFLVPGKSNGDIYLARADGSVARITKSIKGAFYHEVEWHDFNGDGVLDILTCRATKTGNLFTGFKFAGEMVWLENPGRSKMDKTLWKEHLITTGPDVIFKSVPYKGGLAVFSTEFWNPLGPRVSVYHISSRGDLLRSRTIDDNLGKPFALDFVDLDGDGVKDLLVTNHQGPKDEILPAVFAYEVDWKNLIDGDYPRHTLAYGPSENKVDNRGVGAPGFAHGFYPRKGMKGPKYIFAAGDGAFDVWILKPTGRRPFEYETQIIDINGTTGQILEYDYDGDGVLDLLVPDNDYWKLHIITFE